MYRVLITGSRNHNDKQFIYDILDDMLGGIRDDITIIHGDARGADTIAHFYAVDNNLMIERHPAQWDQYGKRAGSIRNQEMVDTGADICLAFPIGKSIGTFDCIRRAKQAGIDTQIFEQ